MKLKYGLMITVLGLSALSSGIFVQAQQAPVAPNHATQAQTALPSVQSAPTVPTAPTAPTAPTPPTAPNADPLDDVMFPPDLIMRHARELGLTDEQKSFMRGEIQKATSRFNELQWQLQDAMELLHQTMEPKTVNDQQALSQLDKVLDVEREIKRLHVGLGIRIKNQLTTEQVSRLQILRRAPWPEGQPRPSE